MRMRGRLARACPDHSASGKLMFRFAAFARDAASPGAAKKKGASIPRQRIKSLNDMLLPQTPRSLMRLDASTLIGVALT